MSFVWVSIFFRVGVFEEGDKNNKNVFFLGISVEKFIGIYLEMILVLIEFYL